MSVGSRASAQPASHRSRRERRIEQTQEIQVRQTHRRRKVLTRGGVLAGFLLAMVVYPVMGTLTPYADAVESVPGVVAGQSPSTARALLGGGPQLVESALILPEIDASSVIATSIEIDVSQHLPGCDPSVGWEGQNGRLTAASLCDIGNGEKLRNDAAVAFAEMNYRFKEDFGRDICLTDTYRTLSGQYATKARAGFMAATPGTSVHGWGLAIDLCSSDARGPAKAWLEENGAAWGWVNPSWAKSTKWEPWHFEYKPGTDELGVYGGNYNASAYRSSSY